MKLLAAFFALVFGIIGLGTLLEKRTAAAATPAPSTPLALTAATPKPSPGAWMWSKQARTALDQRTRVTPVVPVASSTSNNSPRSTTWSPSPGSSSGEWIEHDSRVSAMQAVGGGSSRKRH